MVSSSPRVPGVVAMVTDRSGNIYEGAAGKRMLGQDADMTTDCVFAIFSTTKAITGTAVMQCVEEGPGRGELNICGETDYVFRREVPKIPAYCPLV
jgi:hypothetical protein